LAFALRQFFENFFFLVMRRCSFPNFGRNFLSGWHWSTTSSRSIDADEAPSGQAYSVPGEALGVGSWRFCYTSRQPD
jgi:hypothetical protein